MLINNVEDFADPPTLGTVETAFKEIAHGTWRADPLRRVHARAFHALLRGDPEAVLGEISWRICRRRRRRRDDGCLPDRFRPAEAPEERANSVGVLCCVGKRRFTAHPCRSSAARAADRRVSRRQPISQVWARHRQRVTKRGKRLRRHGTPFGQALAARKSFRAHDLPKFGTRTAQFGGWGESVAE
jgi:hypothetical protein